LGKLVKGDHPVKIRQGLTAVFALGVSCALVAATPASAEGWGFPWKKVDNSSRRSPTNTPSLWMRTKTTSKKAASKTWEYVTLKPVRQKMTDKKSGIVTSPTIAQSNKSNDRGTFSWFKGDDKPKEVRVASRPKSSDKQWYDPRDWFSSESKTEQRSPETIGSFLNQPRPGSDIRYE
jgi:hypothetical protein